MSSNSFLVVSLEFYRYSIISSANSDGFISFPIWIPLISFSSMIAKAQISKTMLNSSGESGHPCLFHDLSGNAFSFSSLRMMLAVGFSYMVFIVLRQVPFMSTLWKDYHNMLMFSQLSPDYSAIDSVLTYSYQVRETFNMTRDWLYLSSFGVNAFAPQLSVGKLLHHRSFKIHCLRYRLLYIRHINDKDLLCGIGDYIQYLVISYGKESEKECISIYN